MRLSEIPTDQFSDIMCEIAPAISNLAEDDQVVDSVMAALEKAKAKPAALLLHIITNLLPALLGAHREDTYAIIAKLSGKTIDEVCKQDVAHTGADIKALLNMELVDFFTPAAMRGAE